MYLVSFAYSFCSTLIAFAGCKRLSVFLTRVRLYLVFAHGDLVYIWCKRAVLYGNSLGRAPPLCHSVFVQSRRSVDFICISFGENSLTLKLFFKHASACRIRRSYAILKCCKGTPTELAQIDIWATVYALCKFAHSSVWAHAIQCVSSHDSMCDLTASNTIAHAIQGVGSLDVSGELLCTSAMSSRDAMNGLLCSAVMSSRDIITGWRLRWLQAATNMGNTL